MKEKLTKVLAEIRTYLQADGGDIELVNLDENKGAIKLRLTGACAGCPISMLTIKGVIESTIKKELPEIKEILVV